MQQWFNTPDVIGSEQSMNIARDAARNRGAETPRNQLTVDLFQKTGNFAELIMSAFRDDQLIRRAAGD
jgi:hypothetical protein